MANLTKAQLSGSREQKLRNIVQYAYRNSPAFRVRLDQVGLRPEAITTAEALDQIPVLRKDELIDLQGDDPPFGGLLGVSLRNLRRIFQSPGPIYDPQGSVEDYWGWAEALKLAGFVSEDIAINTFSYHLSPAGFMFDDGLAAIGATVIPAGVGNTELQVRIIDDLKVTGFVGTPSFLVLLLNKAKELRTDFPIKKAFVAAEPFTQTQRKTCREHGIAVYEGYGTADVGALAFNCNQKSGMHVSSDIILEIVDPNTGKRLPPEATGEVVVTRFDETYPLIRFGTGDLSKLIVEGCPCGLVTERIAGFMGRIGDAVKVRGMFVHPRQISEIISRFPQLGGFVVEITMDNDRDLMTLKVEIDDLAASESIRHRVEELIRDVLRISADKIEFVKKGTLGTSGEIIDKREWGQ